jgi:hypothetical protein
MNKVEAAWRPPHSNTPNAGVPASSRGVPPSSRPGLTAGRPTPCPAPPSKPLTLWAPPDLAPRAAPPAPAPPPAAPRRAFPPTKPTPVAPAASDVEQTLVRVHVSVEPDVEQTIVPACEPPAIESERALARLRASSVDDERA